MHQAVYCKLREVEPARVDFDGQITQPQSSRPRHFEQKKKE